MGFDGLGTRMTIMKIKAKDRQNKPGFPWCCLNLLEWKWKESQFFCPFSFSCYGNPCRSGKGVYLSVFHCIKYMPRMDYCSSNSIFNLLVNYSKRQRKKAFMSMWIQNNSTDFSFSSMAKKKEYIHVLIDSI